jgi:ABC-2 type transport system ATP-binding protein
MDSYVLEAKELKKTYRGGTQALRGVSLSIKQGSIFGLLGPNGAGKTTFVKIAATQLLPTSGSIVILGRDVVKEARYIRERIAVVPQEARPMSLQTPYEHILTYLIARGIDRSEAKMRVEKILSELNLKEYRNTICANLSGGLRQRVLIAMAMSSDADLLVLDEPTIGLDPLARVDVWNLIRDYVSKSHRTIMLTTHYMDEADALSDELAIIDRGRVVARGTPLEIKASLKATHVVIVKVPESNHAVDANGGIPLDDYGKVLRAGSNVRVFTDQKKANELTSLCLERNVDVSVRAVSLEDVFISMVGRHIDEE